MNRCYGVNMKAGIDLSLETLRRHPGLEIRAVETDPAHSGGADALVEITSSAGTSEYVAEYKRGVTTTTLPRVLAQLEALRHAVHLPPLLLAPYLTPAVASRLVEERTEFADAAGNVFLNGPAAYIQVSGQKRRSEPAESGFTATDLQLIFALLAQPELREATYRELSARTGASLGKISGTVRKLESLGHVARTQSGLLLLRDPKPLLERWEFGYLEQLRPSLRPEGWRIGPPSRLAEVRDRVKTLNGVLIGGEHAADAITKYLTPSTLTLHVPKGEGSAVAKHLHLARGGTKPDVVTLERFAPIARDESEPAVDVYMGSTECGIAHPILVRAELLALDDPRLRNVAERILAESILPGLHHGVT